MKPAKRTWKRRVVWIAAGLGAIAALAYSFRPAAVIADAAVVSRGTLRVTVDDDGQTRVRERYTISAPIAGRLLRTALEPGDPVRVRETLVAEFVPVAPSLLDARSRGEAVARVSRADAAFRAGEARQAQAAADLRLAETELQRVKELRARGSLPEEALDRAVRDEMSAREGLRAAELDVEVARYERELASASLVESSAEDDEAGRTGTQPDPIDVPPLRTEEYLLVPDERESESGRLLLRSPIEGTVLRVFEESARTLEAGTPILEVGNTDALEIVADFLSQDAVKVAPGMSVLVGDWGGELPDGTDRALEGRVRVVEPGGFTKVSALGVEEQRVNIVVDPVGELAAWASLGDGYRVELRIVLWEKDDVLIVPTGALFRRGDGWAVFVVEDEYARERRVVPGRRNGLEAQVLSGLDEGERVILYPSELIRDGARIDVR